MKLPVQPQTSPRRNFDFGILVRVLLALGVGALAISTQSFWIDEACTATIAAAPTPGAWWQAMLHDAGSDLQMPLYMAFIWFWEKLAGHGEWPLRAANLVWLALGVAAVPRRRPVFIALILARPFVWYYLGEARPYTMQIAAALLLVGSLLRLEQKPEKIYLRLFGIGLVLLAGSSLIGMVWAGAFLFAAIFICGFQNFFRFVRENVLAVLATAFFLAALAAYYLWTLKYALGVTPGETGVRNILFAGYELLGFTGLGPGRAQIRDAGLAAFKPFWPLLALQGLVTAAVLLAGIWKMFQSLPRRVWLGVTFAFVLAAIFLLAVGALKHDRVLGRHFAPLVPVLIFLLAAGCREFWRRGKFWRVIVGLFLALTLASAFSVRFAERHARDDYRAAAALAHDCLAQGRRVWWCAYLTAGSFYGVPVSNPGELPAPGLAWPAFVFSENVITNQPPPDVVILSRPEIYDPPGFVRALLVRDHYRLAETPWQFAVWRKPETPVNAAAP